jgi:P-type Ca2+ transporter type 2B
MSVIYYNEEKKKHYIFSKGAPEILLENCKQYISKTNVVTPIDSSWREEFRKIISEFSSQSLRTLLLCYKELTKEEAGTEHPEELEENLIVIGVVGIKDPLKESVPEAVLNCKKAGIIVRMVTGDNTETATAIAKEAHILPSNFERPTVEGTKNYYTVMEGKDFRELTGGIVQKEVGKDDEDY